MDLLNRIRDKEPDTFLELTDRYGWSVYAHIRRSCADKAVADSLYNETMNRFYRSLQNDDSDDVVEALLCGFADGIAATPLQEAPPVITRQTTAQKKVKRSPRVGFLGMLGILLLLAAIGATLWVFVGLLMELGFVPYVDIGYDRFFQMLTELTGGYGT